MNPSIRNTRLYVLSPEIAVIHDFEVNSSIIHPSVSATMMTVSSGLYSSHSPGRSRCGSAAVLISTSILMSCAVTARLPIGADDQAIATETINSTTNIAIDCHRKIVSVNGMMPTILNSAGGSDVGFACNCAAEDDRPSAHVAPRPR